MQNVLCVPVNANGLGISVGFTGFLTQTTPNNDEDGELFGEDRLICRIVPTTVSSVPRLSRRSSYIRSVPVDRHTTGQHSTASSILSASTRLNGACQALIRQIQKLVGDRSRNRPVVELQYSDVLVPACHPYIEKTWYYFTSMNKQVRSAVK